MKLGTVFLSEKFINDGKDTATINLAGQMNFKSLPSSYSMFAVLTILDARKESTYDVTITINDPDKKEVFQGALNGINIGNSIDISKVRKISSVISVKCPPISFKKSGIYNLKAFVKDRNSSDEDSEQFYFSVEETKNHGK
ncbi:hypothetical protein EWH99_10560 [Sporolactobacillus sp. THM7-7]|nr:hypothetical protein EWH99_10560 [Sporolactobacillus sp. THM7-7]